MARTVVTEKADVSDANADRTRWGGVLLALGLVLTLVAFTLFFTIPAATQGATPAQNAARVTANAATYQLSGYIGVFGDALLALGAFFLVTRWVPSVRGLPASAFWLFAALGALLFLAVDAFTATGFGTLARAAAAPGASTAVFEAVDATLNLLVGIAVLALSVGFIAVLWGEAASAHRAIPKWLAYIGILGGLTGIPAGVGAITGIQALQVLFLGAYLAFLPLLALALRIAWPKGLGLASAQAPIARA